MTMYKFKVGERYEMPPFAMWDEISSRPGIFIGTTQMDSYKGRKMFVNPDSPLKNGVVVCYFLDAEKLETVTENNALILRKNSKSADSNYPFDGSLIFDVITFYHNMGLFRRLSNIIRNEAISHEEGES